MNTGIPKHETSVTPIKPNEIREGLDSRPKTIIDVFQGQPQTKNDFYLKRMQHLGPEIQAKLEENFGVYDWDEEGAPIKICPESIEERNKAFFSSAFIDGQLFHNKGNTLNEMMVYYSLPEISKTELTNISGVPVLYVPDDFIVGENYKEAGAFVVMRELENIAGIVVVKSGDPTVDLLNLRHEFVHIANNALKEKFNLTEENESLLQILWSFIDEFLAYGTNRFPLEEKITSVDEVWGPYMGILEPDEQDLAIAEKWKEVINIAISDRTGVTENKIKFYLLQYAKQYKDIDLSNHETLTFFKAKTGIIIP